MPLSRGRVARLVGVHGACAFIFFPRVNLCVDIRGPLAGLSFLLAPGFPMPPRALRPTLSPPLCLGHTQQGLQPDTKSLDTDMASDGLLSVYFSFI